MVSIVIYRSPSSTLQATDLIHVEARVLIFYSSKLFDDFKNQKLWTAPIREVWEKLESSGLSKDPWQKELVLSGSRALPPTLVDCSSSVNNVQGDLVYTGIPSTGTTYPTILRERKSPASREEDTSTSEPQQKRQCVREEITTSSNTDDVKDIDHDVRNDDLLGQNEWFDLPGPSNYKVPDLAKSHRHCFERYLE
jgi:hypothetical protein